MESPQDLKMKTCGESVAGEVRRVFCSGYLYGWNRNQMKNEAFLQFRKVQSGENCKNAIRSTGHSDLLIQDRRSGQNDHLQLGTSRGKLLDDR